MNSHLSAVTKLIALSCTTLLAAPATATTVFTDSFDVASTNWGPVTGGSAGDSSLDYNSTEETYEMTASHFENPTPTVGSDTFYTYTASGIDFGTGPVTVAFDGKLLAGLPGTAIHVRINGNFFGAIMGSFNETSYSPFSQELDLSEGFEGTDTLVLEFQFAMGPVANAGGSLGVDNISVNTTIPEPSSGLIVGMGGLALLMTRRRKAR